MKDIIRIIFIQFVVAISYIIFVVIGILIIYLVHKLLGNIKIVESLFITIIWLFIALSLLLFSILSNAISYAIISSFYYKHKENKKEKIIPIDYDDLKNVNKQNKVIKNTGLVLGIIAIIGGSSLTYQIISGNANLNIEFIRNMEITAHRGASVEYPENTMSAFRGAKELGADWIELDVQQTKDRQIVVSHDTNVKRITGIDRGIIDMTYNEISKLDVGSFFDDKFVGEKMPLLDEVLEFASKNSIRLNIELKPTGQEVDFEKQVVELIKKYHFENRCVVTSLNYEVIENTKKVDPHIKTAYVMSIAIGQITDLECADKLLEAMASE